jgi:pilus assembly protein CpaD
MAKSDVMRAAAFAAVLLAGSCAGPDGGRDLVADPDVNHPIVVEQASKTLDLSFSPGDAGLMPDDSARFDEFVSGYLARGGTGSISVAVPAGAGSSQAIEYFGERLAAAGVPRARIMVGTRNTVGNTVELGYVGYVAHTDPCGDWSEDAADNFENQPMPNFGCSVQHNIAAQVEDARDLASPRALGATDATRRSVVIGNYQKGAPTAATKTADQSVAVSDVH